MEVAFILEGNSTSNFAESSSFDGNSTSRKSTAQDEGAMFAFIFCGIFLLMILVILILVCKVCALRRAIVPDVYATEFGEGGRAVALRMPAFNKQ